MKKKNSTTQSHEIFKKLVAVQEQVAEVTVDQIDASDLPDIPYKPMCYLQCSDNKNRIFSFYAFIIVPSTAKVSGCIIHQVNSYNYVKLLITTSDDNSTSDDDPRTIFFMTITGMPAPIGYKQSSVELTVIGSEESSGVGTPPQGQGKTAVDYQDADEELDPSPQKKA